MRLGIFGGTFDPVHLGHLILAEQCREQAGLDRVLFVPAARPPHKRDVPLTPFERRVEMLALAISGQPAFVVDEVEKERPGPSYTADTVEELKKRDRSAELFLIVGADSLIDMPTWYEPRRIVAQAKLLVVARPEWQLPAGEELKRRFGMSGDEALEAALVHMPLIDISSRRLRRSIAEGRSVRYQLPRAVEAYIHDKAMYRKS